MGLLRASARRIFRISPLLFLNPNPRPQFSNQNDVFASVLFFLLSHLSVRSLKSFLKLLIHHIGLGRFRLSADNQRPDYILVSARNIDVCTQVIIVFSSHFPSAYRLAPSPLKTF